MSQGRLGVLLSDVDSLHGDVFLDDDDDDVDAYCCLEHFDFRLGLFFDPSWSLGSGVSTICISILCIRLVRHLESVCNRACDRILLRLCCRAPRVSDPD